MFLLYIIDYLGKEIPADSIALVNQCFNLLILLLVLLFGIINILGYLLSIIVLQKYEDKLTRDYPFLTRILNFYVKRTIFFIILESVLVFSNIIFLICVCYTIIISNINKYYLNIIISTVRFVTSGTTVFLKASFLPQPFFCSAPVLPSLLRILAKQAR